MGNWSTSVASPYSYEQVALLVSWISSTAVPKDKVARAFRDSRFYFVPARKGEEVGMHGDDGSAGEGRYRRRTKEGSTQLIVPQLVCQGTCTSETGECHDD